MIVAAVAAALAAPRAEARAKGDVNNDGAVNGRDAAAFVAVLLAPGSADAGARCAADTSEDGSVNLADVGPLVDLMLGRVPAFYATRGHWECPFEWGYPGAPMTPIHAALVPIRETPGGEIRLEVFTFGDYYNPNFYRWNPQTGGFTPILWPETSVVRQCGQSLPPAMAKLFCSAHTFLADGRLLIAGGDVLGPDLWCDNSDEPAWSGLRYAHIYDGLNLPDAAPAPIAEMAQGRWYPTNTTLADGRVLTVAGFNECGYCDGDGDPTSIDNTDVEIFIPPDAQNPGGAWAYAGDYYLPVYPQMLLLSSGAVFYAGPGRDTARFHPQTQTWSPTEWMNYPYRMYGPAVLVPDEPDTVMVMGGANYGPSTRSTEIIHLQDSNPQWAYGPNMVLPRCHPVAVLLPDQSLLVVGGRRDGCFPSSTALPAYAAERYDFLASSPTWEAMSAQSRPRMYHSTALLLPDGRVVSMGGTKTTGWPEDETNAEIFHPPYLYRGPRPVIASAPASAGYGQQIAVSTPSAGDISSVVLMRLGSVTHATHFDQRAVPLSFGPGGPPGTLMVSMPAQGAAAPPGYYLMFVVNGQRVPSEGRLMRLDL